MSKRIDAAASLTSALVAYGMATTVEGKIAAFDEFVAALNPVLTDAYGPAPFPAPAEDHATVQRRRLVNALRRHYHNYDGAPDSGHRCMDYLVCGAAADLLEGKYETACVGFDYYWNVCGFFANAKARPTFYDFVLAELAHVAEMADEGAPVFTLVTEAVTELVALGREGVAK